jgi:hypothetical protein
MHPNHTSSPFLPSEDTLVDAIAYTPPIPIDSLSLSPQLSSSDSSPRRYPNAPPGHHTASQENHTSPLPKRFKFYAIRFGRTNNIICRSWAECASTSSATLTHNTNPSLPTPKPSPTYAKLHLSTPDDKTCPTQPLSPKCTPSNHILFPNLPASASPCGSKASTISPK